MTFNDISLDKNRIMFCKTSEPQVLNIIVCYMIDDSKNLKNVSYHYIEKKEPKGCETSHAAKEMENE